MNAKPKQWINAKISGNTEDVQAGAGETVQPDWLFDILSAEQQKKQQ